MKRIIIGLCLGAALGFPLLAFTLSPSGKTIEVSVNLSDALKLEGANSWPLYIYASRPNTRLPLSSFKGKYEDLPLTVTLTEDMYLLPELTLKDADQVVIVAKVSKSTDPHKKSSEDLIGYSQVIDFKSNGQNQSISVTINQKDKVPSK